MGGALTTYAVWKGRMGRKKWHIRKALSLAVVPEIANFIGNFAIAHYRS
jgi:hypothetical protein